jgi:hypothetical protein
MLMDKLQQERLVVAVAWGEEGAYLAMGPGRGCQQRRPRRR